MPQFQPGETKTAVLSIPVTPAGLECSAELFLTADGTTMAATSGPQTFTSTGVAQGFQLPITMPQDPNTYQVRLVVMSGGSQIAGFQANEDVVIATSGGGGGGGETGGNIELSNLMMNAPVMPGALTGVACYVTNNGNTAALVTLTMTFQGATQTKTVTIGPGETEYVSFMFTVPTTLGFYDVSINDKTTKFEVLAADPNNLCWFRGEIVGQQASYDRMQPAAITIKVTDCFDAVWDSGSRTGPGVNIGKNLIGQTVTIWMNMYQYFDIWDWLVQISPRDTMIGKTYDFKATYTNNYLVIGNAETHEVSYAYFDTGWWVQDFRAVRKFPDSYYQFNASETYIQYVTGYFYNTNDGYPLNVKRSLPVLHLTIRGEAPSCRVLIIYGIVDWLGRPILPPPYMPQQSGLYTYSKFTSGPCEDKRIVIKPYTGGVTYIDLGVNEGSEYYISAMAIYATPEVDAPINLLGDEILGGVEPIWELIWHI